jgi:hypothetical protein
MPNQETQVTATKSTSIMLPIKYRIYYGKVIREHDVATSYDELMNVVTNLLGKGMTRIEIIVIS